MMCALPERGQINPDEYWRSAGGGNDDSDIESIDTNAGIGIVIDTSAIGSILSFHPPSSVGCSLNCV